MLTTENHEPFIIRESKFIDAPAEAIFSILCNPSTHREFDGSSMLVSSTDSIVHAVGDTFKVSMHNSMRGDYEMVNTVVIFTPNEEIAWAPRLADPSEDSWHHRWGWRLRQLGNGTQVEEYFDCSRSSEEVRGILRNGEWARPHLIASLEKLSQLNLD